MALSQLLLYLSTACEPPPPDPMSCKPSTASSMISMASLSSSVSGGEACEASPPR